MHNELDEKKYEQMIRALAIFSDTVADDISTIYGYAKICRNSLGVEDEDMKIICDNVKQLTRWYLGLSGTAINIAKSMQAELDYFQEKRRKALSDNP